MVGKQKHSLCRICRFEGNLRSILPWLTRMKWSNSFTSCCLTSVIEFYTYIYICVSIYAKFFEFPRCKRKSLPPFGKRNCSQNQWQKQYTLYIQANGMLYFHTNNNFLEKQKHLSSSIISNQGTLCQQTLKKKKKHISNLFKRPSYSKCSGCKRMML